MYSDLANRKITKHHPSRLITRAMLSDTNRGSPVLINAFWLSVLITIAERAKLKHAQGVAKRPVGNISGLKYEIRDHTRKVKSRN